LRSLPSGPRLTSTKPAAGHFATSDFSDIDSAGRADRLSPPAKRAGDAYKESPAMSQNLIDLELSADALAAIDAALSALEANTAGLRGLDNDARRSLTKMGDKSEAFCRQAVTAFTQNADVLPRNFDLAAYQRDLAALDALRPRLQRLARLHELLDDAEMALGSDLMTASLEGYAVLKVAGKGTGLDGMRQMLSERFTRGRKAETTVRTLQPA
jgi:hypothetical protein